MNVLAIGNSFSQDATRYVHRIARADGFLLNVVNLYIGGCPIDLHFRNMHSDERAYELQYNGEPTLFKVSLKEALLNREWDYITIQQASRFSFRYESYQPYLNELCDYIKKLCPKAKLLIHQTWAYENESIRLKDAGYSSHEEMFSDIEKSYDKAAKDINAEFIIPSGKLIEKLSESGIEKVHRDTFHLTKGLSRYAVGLLWYAILSGNDIENNTFRDFDEEVTKEEIEITKKCVKELI